MVRPGGRHLGHCGRPWGSITKALPSPGQHSLRIPLNTRVSLFSDNVASACKLSLTGGLGKPASYDFIKVAPQSDSVIIPALADRQIRVVQNSPAACDQSLIFQSTTLSFNFDAFAFDRQIQQCSSLFPLFKLCRV